MASSSFLYFLLFPKADLMKIGKADVVAVRIASLRKHWGMPDCANSYSLEVPAEMSLQLESAMHVFLRRYSAPQETGEGRTEMFRIEALEPALDLARHISVECRVQKGIALEVGHGENPVNPMLAEVFGGASRQKALQWLYEHPQQDYGTREIAVAAGIDSGNASRWLRRWAELGILQRGFGKTGPVYRASPDPRLEGLKLLFQEARAEA